MLRWIVLTLALVTTAVFPATALAQSVPSLVAGQVIPRGRRVFIAQGVPYRIGETSVSIEVSGSCNVTSRAVVGARRRCWR